MEKKNAPFVNRNYHMSVQALVFNEQGSNFKHWHVRKLKHTCPAPHTQNAKTYQQAQRIH